MLRRYTESLEFKPDILIIGTGSFGRMKVPDGVREKIESLGVEVFILKTGKAVRKYNEIFSERKTVATFHLTC